MNKSLWLYFQTLFLLRFWITVTRAFQRYITWPHYEEKQIIPIWRHNPNMASQYDVILKCDVIKFGIKFFLQNRGMLYTVRKLSSRWFRIAIETGSENKVIEIYSWFTKVTWPWQKWGIITREVLIAQKSFYTRFSWENHGFIGFFSCYRQNLRVKGWKMGKTVKIISPFF